MQQRLPLSVDEAFLILEELRTRAEMRNFSVIDENFQKQAAFIRDPARRKAAKCTRRAGKTTAAQIGLVQACIENEGVDTLYIGLTYDTCRRLFWNPLKKLLKRYAQKISYKLHESRLEVAFGNGAHIFCLGMNADKDQMEKMLGGKYKRVVVDESGSFRVDVEKMVEEMLWPALADLEGDIWLIGTPVEFTGSYYYKMTRDDKEPRLPGWSVHEWSGHDNPYMARQWQRELDDILKLRPRFMETPAYKRMWLGKWVIDSSRLVYKYMRDRNWVPELPGNHADYNYGLGVDLGWDDATTFVLSAYATNSRKLYLMKPFKKSGMDITDVADKIKEYQRRYNILSVVIDGSAKQSVMEMRSRHGLPGLEAADKRDKAEFIDLFNAELIQGEIVLVGPDTDIIEEEWANLIWDPEKEDKRQEHPGCENHLADAALYIWRKQYQYLYQAPATKENVSEEKRIDRWAEEQSAFLKLNDAKPFWEREYG